MDTRVYSVTEAAYRSTVSKQPSSTSRPGGSADVSAMTFEQALAEVESIIERIETGEIGLEESLKEYERGVVLIKHCGGKLDRAQQQVEDLTRRLKEADEGDASVRTEQSGAGEPPF